MSCIAPTVLLIAGPWRHPNKMIGRKWFRFVLVGDCDKINHKPCLLLSHVVLSVTDILGGRTCVSINYVSIKISAAGFDC